MTSETSTACSRCGNAVLTAETLYTDAGEVVCPRCDLDLKTQDAIAIAGTKFAKIAYGVPGAGLLAFFWNPLGLFSIGAVATGLYVLRSLRTDPRLGARLAHRIAPLRLFALGGIALGVVSGLLTLARLAPR